jgi:nucleoside 2-deoxyribosyltransferase
MIVVGGTYDEYCFEPRWEKKFGSGLRACWVFGRLEPDEEVNYFTFGDDNTEQYLQQVATEIKLNYSMKPIKQAVQFRYEYPLADPVVTPRPDTLKSHENSIEVNGGHILFYGMIEGNAIISGDKVIYDPQSPSNPIPFSATGSKAKHLAIVINIVEARKIVGLKDTDLKKIEEFFFNQEGAEVLIIKMGAKGALIKTKDGKEEIIPVYETKSIWPIGSGDVFAASFAHNWIKLDDPIQAAKNASWDTAVYCSTRNFNFKPFESDPEIKPFKILNYPKEQVYLAGPFFTFSERWLIDQIYHCLKAMNLNVFSPWHHVGLGDASVVVPLDIKGLNESKLVFAVLDGLDSGTLFEIGFAIAKDCTVIGYVENETSDSIKMLEGTNCVIEKDLTTAIYKCLWALSKNE